MDSKLYTYFPCLCPKFGITGCIPSGVLNFVHVFPFLSLYLPTWYLLWNLKCFCGCKQEREKKQLSKRGLDGSDLLEE